MNQIKTLVSVVLMLLGFILLFVGPIFLLWFGITTAVDNWSIDNQAVVWGIILSVFSGVGAIPGIIILGIGYYLEYTK